MRQAHTTQSGGSDTVSYQPVAATLFCSQEVPNLQVKADAETIISVQLRTDSRESELSTFREGSSDPREPRKSPQRRRPWGSWFAYRHIDYSRNISPKLCLSSTSLAFIISPFVSPPHLSPQSPHSLLGKDDLLCGVAENSSLHIVLVYVTCCLPWLLLSLGAN